jgi:AcrR family transcriptional regulator
LSPTQQERSDATTAALVAAARPLFAADGYAATSLDAVVAKAGLTKGALYHHFASKRELFAAVFAAEQGRLGGAVVAAYAGETDAWRAFEAGAVAFVEACLEPGVQRIALLDAPSALGWETVRELESGALEMMKRGVERAIEEGAIGERPVEPLAHLLFGAICEVANLAARADDANAGARDGIAELRRVLRSLARE